MPPSTRASRWTRAGRPSLSLAPTAECRGFAEQNGWEIAETYIDNDKSPSTGKPRPEWSRLLSDLAAGRHDVLVVWHTDRLYRRLRDLVDLVEIAEKRSLKIATSRSSDLDLSTPSGRMVASLLGSVAAYEGQQKAARQVAANRQRAQSGVVLWSRRPFGFDRDGSHVRVVDSEAAEIRKAAAAALSGATLASIASNMNARGVTTSAGMPWTVTAVRRALASALGWRDGWSARVRISAAPRRPSWTPARSIG